MKVGINHHLDRSPDLLSTTRVPTLHHLDRSPDLLSTTKVPTLHHLDRSPDLLSTTRVPTLHHLDRSPDLLSTTRVPTLHHLDRSLKERSELRRSGEISLSLMMLFRRYPSASFVRLRKAFGGLTSVGMMGNLYLLGNSMMDRSFVILRHNSVFDILKARDIVILSGMSDLPSLNNRIQ